MNRVALDVARLAGVPMKQRTIPWASVILAVAIGAPLAYWTYKLNQHGFRWYSALPGAIAGFMALSILGMLFSGSSDELPTDDEAFVVHPLAGDVNARPPEGNPPPES
jgi:hypothetical protein